MRKDLQNRETDGIKMSKPTRYKLFYLIDDDRGLYSFYILHGLASSVFFLAMPCSTWDLSSLTRD